MKQGLLILIGGAEDRKHDKKVLKTVLEKTNAKRIAVIPTASSYQREVYNVYRNAFRDLGADIVYDLDIRYSNEADRDENLKVLDDIDLLFMSGGDQTKLADVFLGTKFYDEIKKRFLSGKLHIAGTSAGSAVVSNPMLFDGDYKGFIKESINTAEGFGLLPTITVDTHFLQRERIARLSQFLASGKSNKGIGLDEDTAIIIYPNFKFEVVGSGMVTVMHSGRLTGNNYSKIEKNEIINFNNIRIGFLSEGGKFNLKRWTILSPNSKICEANMELTNK